MIGKDGPLFLAVALAVWSTMQIRRRWIGFLAAAAVMTALRPHVAFLALACLAVTFMLDSRTSPRARIPLFLAGVIGVAIVASTLQSTMNVDVYDANSVSSFIEARQEIGAGYKNNAFVYSALYVRVFALLFFPLFIGMEDSYGIIASFENTFLLGVFAFLLWNIGIIAQLTRRVAFIRFSVVFAVSLTILLSMVYYNVGLGLRQKMMLMPPILTIFVATLAARSMRRRTAQAAGAAPVTARVDQRPVALRHSEL
jgi:hypothetical protein